MTTGVRTEEQMELGEAVMDDPQMGDLLNEWNENRDGAAKYKEALKSIKEICPDEPGRYRYGPFVVVVGKKKTVKIEAADGE